MLGVQALAESLKPSKSILLTGIRKTLEKKELVGLLECINEIVDDVHCTGSTMTRMQICNCVKPEVNAFLDAARTRFNQLSEDLQQQREAFEQPDQLPSAKLAHSKPYGWHIAFKRALLTGTVDSSESKRRKLASESMLCFFKTLLVVSENHWGRGWGFEEVGGRAGCWLFLSLAGRRRQSEAMSQHLCRALRMCRCRYQAATRVLAAACQQDNCFVHDT